MATVRIRRLGHKPIVRHYSFSNIAVTPEKEAVLVFERREDKMSITISAEEVAAMAAMLKGG